VSASTSVRLPAMRTRDMLAFAELRAIRGVLEAAVRYALDL
jgi:hypothetical protein